MESTWMKEIKELMVKWGGPSQSTGAFAIAIGLVAIAEAITTVAKKLEK